MGRPFMSSLPWKTPVVTRDPGCRGKVSAILSLSDGMLSDFLCRHVICTIKCTAATSDRAHLLPGRLVAPREVRRLDIAQASRLAESVGKTLPPASDYSLAEVFAEDGSDPVLRQSMGFSDAENHPFSRKILLAQMLQTRYKFI